MASTDIDAERTAELRKKVEFQVACEERAHRIVERLIDNPITQEQLINALHYITQSHYTDIVEERAVSKLCGYPLCPNSLANVPKQKYMISTKTNKVYDIESRKNFCSTKCYKASKHLECQVSNDPVWSRKNVQPTQFDLLPLDMKTGKLGEEVVVSKAVDIRVDLTRLEKLEKYEKNLAERIHEHNQEQQQPEETEEAHNNDSSRASDGEKTNSSRVDDSVVYTLGKAVNELNIENNESDKTDGKSRQHVSSAVATSSSVGSSDKKRSEIEGKSDLTEKGDSYKISDKHAESKKSKRSKVTDASKSKTDYLMQLLDKRKALLAKMADIQNDSKNSENKSEQELKSNGASNRDMAETTGKTDDKAEPPEVSVKPIETVRVKSAEKTYSKHVAQKRKEKDLVKNASEDDDKKKTAVSAVDMISRGIKSWITVETVEYFKVKDDNTAVKDAKTAFEKQYDNLVAKVDAQEKDFDGLLGEESMDSDHTDRSSAPLPHFDVLRQEMETDQVRVSEFMKGSFTYKITEKQFASKATDGSTGVVLPTVDRYDQILIRQKIVLDRISKVLPDLLSPLHLLVKDVYTDLRKLICTFNLTSDNIVFKPVEWTLVTLILLRMLSRRLEILAKSFTSPGAEKYFTVLLSSLGSSIDNVDVIVNDVLKIV